MGGESKFLRSDEAALACLRALSVSIGRGTQCVCTDPQGEAALTVAGSAVMVVDSQHRIVHFNQQASELTGWSAVEALGRHCTEALRCINCDSACGLFDEGVILHRPVEIETRTGALVQIIKEGRVIRDAQGRVVGGIETLHDVTALRSAQRDVTDQFEELRSRCNLLQAFAESMDEGFAAIDERGRILCLSQRAADWLGLDREAAHGTSIAECLMDPSALLDKASFVLATQGRSETPELDLRSALPGGATLSMRMSPLLAGDGPPIGAVLVLRRHEAVRESESFFGIVGRSAPVRHLIRQIKSVASGDACVLVSGESGSGKELVARAIHLSSPRARQPFQAINCAALTPDLLESELFGHERGAFTGAIRDKQGRFELAGEGTLLLDEVGCMPLTLQAKLLRVLESREYERVGGIRPLKLRARVIAATNSVLEDLVRTGRFREDLYYRLDVLPLTVPPLRERGADILVLAHWFARQLCRSDSPEGNQVDFTPAAVERMLAHAWPGNVRELRNVVLYALTLGDGAKVDVADLPPAFEAQTRTADRAQSAGERSRIEDALRRTRYNRDAAADALGISRTTLWRRMRALGID